MQPIFSIGYGQRSPQAVLDLLLRHRIRFLIDVRSSPYSSYQTAFSKPALRSYVEEAGLHYVFMGDALGGRPDDPACYVDGRVDYAKCRLRPAFQDGLRRVVGLARAGERVALMCAEERPEDCHRTKLIGEALAADDVDLLHLDEKGEPRPHHAVIAKLTRGQQTLLGPRSFMSRQRHETPRR